MRWRRADGVVVVLAAGATLLVKALTADASAEQLRWLLAPTVSLAGWLTGLTFSWEAGAGYLNPALHYTVAPICAGTSFLAAAVGAALCVLGVDRPTLRARVVGLLAAVPLAVVATLVANVVRLSTALTLLTHDLRLPGLDPAQAHRLLGVVVYLSALLLLVQVRAGLSPRLALAVGAGWYLAVTVAIPILRGHAHDAHFAPHLFTVLAGVAVAWAARHLAGQRRRAPGVVAG